MGNILFLLVSFCILKRYFLSKAQGYLFCSSEWITHSDITNKEMLVNGIQDTWKSFEFWWNLFGSLVWNEIFFRINLNIQYICQNWFGWKWRSWPVEWNISVHLLLLYTFVSALSLFVGTGDFSIHVSSLVYSVVSTFTWISVCRVFWCQAFGDLEPIYTFEGTYDINTLVTGREITGIASFKPVAKTTRMSRL